MEYNLKNLNTLISMAAAAYSHPTAFSHWAQRWLSGEDRSAAAARAAATTCENPHIACTRGSVSWLAAMAAANWAERGPNGETWWTVLLFNVRSWAWSNYISDIISKENTGGRRFVC